MSETGSQDDTGNVFAKIVATAEGFADQYKAAVREAMKVLDRPASDMLVSAEVMLEAVYRHAQSNLGRERVSISHALLWKTIAGEFAATGEAARAAEQDLPAAAAAVVEPAPATDGELAAHPEAEGGGASAC